jgi:hypothetical protein
MFNTNPNPKAPLGSVNSDQSTTTKITDELINLDKVVADMQLIITDPLKGISNIVGTLKNQLGPAGILEALINLDTEATKLVKSFKSTKFYIYFLSFIIVIYYKYTYLFFIHQKHH